MTFIWLSYYIKNISHKFTTDIFKKGGHILGVSAKNKKTLGEKIKNQRNEIDLSQRKLALACEITLLAATQNKNERHIN